MRTGNAMIILLRAEQILFAERCIGSPATQSEIRRLQRVENSTGNELSQSTIKILSLVLSVGRWKTDDLSRALLRIFQIPESSDIFFEDRHQNVVMEWTSTLAAEPKQQATRMHKERVVQLTNALHLINGDIILKHEDVGELGQGPSANQDSCLGR